MDKLTNNGSLVWQYLLMFNNIFSALVMLGKKGIQLFVMILHGEDVLLLIVILVLYFLISDGFQIEQPQSYHCRDDDFLADAMGTRLRLFGESSSEEDEEDDSGDHEGRGSYYSAYMQRATQDLQADDSD